MARCSRYRSISIGWRSPVRRGPIIKTPIHGRTDEQFEELNGMQPLSHVGEVEDIVDAVLYLAGASFVTGVVLPVDGGVAAGGK